MDFITLREYAAEKGVTYEAIRRQVAKYENELRGHVVTRDRTKYLDEYAQRFLSERRRLSPVVVKVEDTHEEAEELQKEVESLRSKLALAREELLAMQQRVIKLHEEREGMIEANTRNKLLLEENDGLRQKLEEASIREESVRADLDQLREESAEKDREHEKQIEALREESEIREEEHEKQIEGLRREAEDRDEESRQMLQRVEQERDEARKEAESFTKSWFGFYRKRTE